MDFWKLPPQPPKPQFDARTREDVDIYSTDDLRREYHEQAMTDGIRLRGSVLKRDELMAEIRWRDWREALKSWIQFWCTVIAAIAAVIAAIFAMFGPL